MITGFDIYVISRLDNIGFILSLVGILCGVAFVIFSIIACIAKAEADGSSYEDSIKKYSAHYNANRKRAKSVLIPAIILISIAVVMPSTKDAIAIWAVPKIVNNEHIQKIPDNFVKLIDEKLQSWLDDISDKKTEKCK